VLSFYRFIFWKSYSFEGKKSPTVSQSPLHYIIVLGKKFDPSFLFALLTQRLHAYFIDVVVLFWVRSSSLFFWESNIYFVHPFSTTTTTTNKIKTFLFPTSNRFYSILVIVVVGSTECAIRWFWRWSSKETTFSPPV